MSSWPSRQRFIFLSCTSRSSKWFLAWPSIFGLKIGQEKQCCPKPQAWFSSADYLYHSLAYRSILYAYKPMMCPSQESLSAVYLSLASWGFSGFVLTLMMLYLLCHWVLVVSFFRLHEYRRIFWRRWRTTFTALLLSVWL